MKIVFFGTPQFGEKVLAALINAKQNVVAVVCQPDRAGNRNKVEFCPVKTLALQFGIEVLQYENVSRDGADDLKRFDADVFVTAAYGQILSQKILDIPKFGVFNVHGSLLPKYRGAAPVQFALLNGDRSTGVTIMKTALAMDSGDVVLQKTVEIEKQDNAETLLQKLATAGGDLLCEFLTKLQNNEVEFEQQDEANATYCSKITAEMAKIDWNRPAEEIFNLIRALNPNPVAFTHLKGAVFKIFASQVVCGENGQPGEVLQCDKNAFKVQCGKDALALLEVQLAGGKKMDFKSFVNGRKVAAGDILGL